MPRNHSRHCALCGGNIDAPPETPLPHDDFRGFVNIIGDVEGFCLEAMRLLPYICHPCFTRADGRSQQVAKQAVKRLQNQVIDQHKVRPSTIDRRRDLMKALMQYVYMNRSWNNTREIGVATKEMVSLADFWKDAAVYRRLRKRLGLKGEVCRAAKRNCAVHNELIYGQRILEIEDHIRKDIHTYHFLCTNWEKHVADVTFCKTYYAGGLKQRLSFFKKRGTPL